MANKDKPQSYRIEIRFDFIGTKEQADQKASEVIGLLYNTGTHSAEVTAMFDENWEEV